MRMLLLGAFITVLGGCVSDALTAPAALAVEASVVPTQARSARVIVCRRERLMPTDRLYVVDGRITPVEEVDRLDAALIDSVEVVKSATATSLYGSRAARGVTIIYTRAERPSEAR